MTGSCLLGWLWFWISILGNGIGFLSGGLTSQSWINYFCRDKRSGDCTPLIYDTKDTLINIGISFSVVGMFFTIATSIALGKKFTNNPASTQQATAQQHTIANPQENIALTDLQRQVNEQRIQIQNIVAQQQIPVL